jgi:hypothetical protein
MERRSSSSFPAAARRNSVVRVAEERGALEVFLPVPTISMVVVSGHLSSAMVEKWIEHFDPLFASGATFRTFLDWEALESYDSAARQRLTSWVVGHIRNITSADFLVSSRLVAMGVSAANLATTLAGLTMRSHTTRRAFDDMLVTALRESSATS